MLSHVCVNNFKNKIVFHAQQILYYAVNGKVLATESNINSLELKINHA
jgi:hypothetical protein